MIVYDKAWNSRQKWMSAIGTVYTVSLSYLLVVSLLGLTLMRQVESPMQRPAQAATCSLPATVSTTIELTPTTSDNVIDCSGQDITVTSTGKIVIKSYQSPNTTVVDDGGVLLKVANLTIETGGEVSATGQGYSAGALDGNSATASTGIAGGSGGGNGGAGGTGNASGGTNVAGATGSSVGLKDYPLYLGGAGGNAGGGGAGGVGGGAVRIQATGTVTVDGKITADGTDGVKSADNQSSGGGGAGGAIWVEANIIAGNGQVTAKGGGTDQTASYYGGGGGGGRIALVCVTSTTFPAGNVSVAFGLGSQNGGVGTILGPGCKPAEPTVLKFFEKNGTAGKVDRELFVTEHTAKTALTFASDLNGSSLYLEVEVRQKDEAFQNVKTGGQVTAATNKTCTGLPTGTGVAIGTYCGYVEMTSGLFVSTQYKWQARIVSAAGIGSNWVQYGGNPISDADFTVVGAPTNLVILEGNNQSVTVGQQTPIRPKVRVVDAAGFGYPFFGGYSWSVVTGGGTVANGMTTADKWGEMTADWTIGQVAGVENNSIKVARTSAPAMNVTLIASALPGAIASYSVNAPSTFTVINNQFTYTVTAKDLYGNVVPFTSNLAVSPVSANDVNVPGLGTLTPEQIILNGTPVNSNWYYTSWNYRNKVTFSNVQATLGVAATDLTDFPVLVKLTSVNFDFSKAQTSGADIRFTDSDGVTSLPFEIEKWDSTNQEALIWVKVPKIDVDSTTDYVYVYYGNGNALTAQNKNAVWSAGFDMVQHFGESSGATTYDSTSKANNGTATGTASVAGILGLGRSFNGTSDHIAAGTTVNSCANPQQCTMSAWVYPTSASGEGYVMAKGSDGANNSYGMLAESAGNAGGMIRTTTLQSFTSAITLNQWQYVTVVIDGATMYYYLDGVQVGTKAITGTVAANSATFWIGAQNRTSYNYRFAGTLDEVSIAATARSAAWVAAAYKSQTGAFTSFGSPENNPGNLTTYQADGSTGVITVPNAVYSHSQNIKIKVQDANGKYGYSNAILFVSAVGTCPAITIDVDQTWPAVNVPNGVYDCRGLGTLTVVGGKTLTLKSYDNVDADWSNDFGVTVLADSFDVQSTGTITATGQGYDGVRGPSAGQSATYDGYGAGHGGYGDAGRVPYGNVYEPTALGSAGGNSGPFCNSGAAGGAMKLVTTGSFTNNGIISSNGAVDSCSNGSGGSIWIQAGPISGALGEITTNGGSGGHGGAGGRIALEYTSNTDYRLTPDGLKSLGKGGSGPGTVYVERVGVDPDKGGMLIVDNNGNNWQKAGLVEGPYAFNLVKLTRYGNLEVMGQNSVITISDGAGMQGDNSMPNMTVSGTFNYTGVGTLKMDGVDLGLNGKATGVTDIEIGGTYAAGVTLYAHTWWYSNVNTHAFGNVLIKGNGVFSMVGYDDASTANDYGVNLSLLSLTVDAGGFLTGSGLGYGGVKGPGAGHSATYDGYGASHGGHSEVGRLAYGNVYEPVTMGSGGGNSGPFCNGVPGGSAIKLTVSGTITNNGTIESNGSTAGCNNAAGGSLWIDTNSIIGTGMLKANGSTSGHGGAGGRIAVYYGTNSGFNLNTTGITAYGYGGSGAGTIYLEQKGVDINKNGILLIDNNNRNISSAGLVEDSYNFKLVKLTRQGHLEVMGQNSVITISDGAGMQGDNTKPKMTVSGTFNYTGAGLLKLDGVDLGLNGKVTGVVDFEIGGVNAAGVTLYANTWWYNKTVTHSFGTMTVKGNGTLSLVSYDGASVDDYGVSLALTGLTVESGGKVTASGLGYGGTAGPGGGASATYDGYGASHGGHSEVSRLAYGNVYEPTTLGSGGGNSGPFCNGVPGGGAMKFVISGALTNNGTIESNGNTTGCNNAAGGSIWIDTNSISGAGIITANGSTGGHGGAGGRIALYYSTNTDYNINITGVTAFGYGASGAGTIYFEQKGVDTAKNGMLLVDNNNRSSSSAGLVEDSYNFKLVKLTRSGNLEVMGQNSIITISDGAGMQGDNTKPKMTVSGTFAYTGTGILKLDGIDLGLNGKVTGVTDVEIGGANAAGVTLYAKTWWYNKTETHSFGLMTVKGNGTLSLVSYDDPSSTVDYGINLALGGLTVESGGVVTASGLGYGGTAGPGGGASATYDGYGASHGGHSEISRMAYGSVYEPTTLGSGGGNSGPFCGGVPGGGAIKLTISGILLNNGTIESNGSTAGCNNAAGGSIWVDTNTISGAGMIKANGSTSGHGGAGGRIALYYGTNTNYNISIAGITAFGYGASGAGTIYLEQKGVDIAKNGMLLVDNNDRNAGSAGLVEDSYNFKLVKLTRQGHLEVMGQNSVITISDGSGMQGDNTKPKMKVSGTFTYTGTSILKLDGVDLALNGKVTGVTDVEIGGVNAAGVTIYAKTWWYNKTVTPEFRDVTIKLNGTLTSVSYDGTGSDDYGTAVTMRNLTIETDGVITATGLGYGGTAGPGGGASATYDGYGASHGGYYLPVLRVPYGDLYQPVTLGSGGGNSGPFCGGASGGGAMKFTVTGILTNNGRIESNGSNAGCNNAAGGSIWIDTGTLTGTGTIKTNGSTSGHGGAGGRVAVYYGTATNVTFDRAHFAAVGGPEAGPGTVYLENKGVHRAQGGDLILDNATRAGRAQDFEARTYNFNNVLIGSNVTVAVKSDLTAINEGVTEATPHSVIVDGSVVGSWSFENSGNNTYSDVSNYARNATATESTVSVPGKFGEGAKVGRTGLGVTMGTPIDVPVEYTIDTWAKFPLPATVDGWRTLAHANGTSYHYLIVHSGGNLGLYNYAWYDTGYNVNSLTGWHHIATVTKETTTDFYIDGVKVGSVANAIHYPMNVIGNAGTEQQFGTIDEFRVQDFALTDEQVATAANASSPYVPDTHTLGLWHFEEYIFGASDDSSTGMYSAYNWNLGAQIVPGKFGNARNFYQSNMVAFETMQLSGEWTIDMWAKFPLPTTGGGWRSLIALESGNYHPVMVHQNGNLGLYAYGFYDTTYNVNALTGWHHIAAVASGTTTDFYVDGVKAGNTIAANPATSISVIGNYMGNAILEAGTLDAVRVSNRAFPVEELASYVTSGVAPVADASTLALWQFDESKSLQLDATNHNFDLQPFGVTQSVGKIGNGMHFSGVQSYLSLPTSTLDFTSGLTVGVWAKPTSNGSYERFVDFGNACPSDNFIMYRAGTSNDLHFETFQGGGTQADFGAVGSIINNEWHHYAVTVDQSGNARMYRDGLLLTSATGINLPALMARTNNYVGRSCSSGDAYYTGDMDELVLFNRALSTEEIGALAAGLTVTEYQAKQQQLIGRGVIFDLTGNFTLETGAVIDGVGVGFPTDQGSGRGNPGVGYSGGAGGANGGDGGAGQSDGQNVAAVGGRKYGDQLVPATLGSGGGSSAVGAAGGTGGGAVAIIAHGVAVDGQYQQGNIQIDGTINMNGAIGKTGSPGGGGGAGGSILLHGNTCSVTGNLTAVGGAGGNSDVDGGNGGGGRVSVLYNVGPCTVTGTVNVSPGTPADMANFGAALGQIGTYPPEPNSVPWPSQYKEQFELKNSTIGQVESGRLLARSRNAVADVLGITESVIPVGGIINGTTVTLKADVYDAGARAVAPKNLKIQVELKKVGQPYNGSTNVYESPSVVFSGGAPIVLSVTATNLDMGASYKWRVRTVNLDNNLFSDWREFGNNGTDEADFTITMVAALDLSIDKTSMNLPETASLTLIARNTQGEVDTSYRGTVHFRSDSATAQLPADYTFTPGDGGQHMFTDSVKFFETGSYTITVEDTTNPILIDTVSINITTPATPFLTIGASVTTISTGGSTILQWSSGYVTGLSIDQGIGAVSDAGSLSISPTQTTTYTITGTSVYGDPMTASVTIDVLASNAPQLSLTAVLTEIAEGGNTTIQWTSAYVTDLHIDNSIGLVDATGTVTVAPLTTTTYIITGMTEGGDTITDSVTVTVVPKNTPFLTIGASQTSLYTGQSTNVVWQSSLVNNLVITQGVGSVSAAGSTRVSPVRTTTYTITGTSIYEKAMSATVTIVVSAIPPSPSPSVKVTTTVTPSRPPITPPIIVDPACPVIVEFKTSATLMKKDDVFVLTWKVVNAQKVSIDAFSGSMPLSGSSSLILKEPQDITIKAVKGECQKTAKIHMEIVPSYPWEGAGGVLIGVALAEIFQGNVWFALLGLIDRAKKKKPWGITYDSVTKKLISRVTLRLWNAQTGKLVDTVVSDANGIFKLAPKKGKYVIKATLADYEFPSKLVNSDSDSGFANVYRGEVVEVESDEQMMMVSIPLDPLKKKNGSFSIKNIVTMLHNAVDVLSPIVLVAGFVYSLVVTIMYPLALNVLILVIYGVVFGIKLMGYLNRPKLFGVVTSVDGKVISGLEIGLYDKEFKTLIARTFTNKKGAYNFVVKNQDYYLQVMDSRYKLLSKQMSKDGVLIPQSHNNSAVKLVTESFMVYLSK